MRKSKRFQQMGPGLIRPSVSEVQGNEKTTVQSLSIVIWEDLRVKKYRSDLGGRRAAAASQLFSLQRFK